MASKGDPRVLFALNAVLSGLFSLVVVAGLAFVGLVTFSWMRVVLATTFLMLVTWVVVLQ